MIVADRGAERSVDLPVLRTGECVRDDVQGADPGGVWGWDHERDRLQDGDRREPDPAGDRVKIVMSGKFLPYKAY